MRKANFLKGFNRRFAILTVFALISTSFMPLNVSAESQNSIDPNQGEMKKDSDKDGVEDVFEGYFGTDLNKFDTDGDKLNDYDEIYVLHLDPTAIDTNKDGITDEKEDTDADGLKNLEEFSYGTSLVKKDTDGDGLTDYDEIFVHNTNPTAYDTDGDGVNDSWEINNGYSPTTYNNTFAIDKKQKANRSSLAFTASLDAATGEQVESLNIKELPQDIQIKDSIPGYLGSCFEVKAKGKVDNLTVSFEFDSNLLNPDFDPAIYYYSDKAPKLKELDNQKINGNVITGTATHLAKFILVDKNLYNAEKDKNKKSTDAVTTNLETVNLAMSLNTLTTTTDSDYDGIDDYMDSYPYDNTFNSTLVNNGTQCTSNVSYTLDYRSFFQSNTQYNSDLSTVSSLWASAIYSGVTLDGRGIAGVMSYHGLSDVVVYKLSDYYSDNHLSEVAIGHRLVTYNGVTKDIVAVVVRGTNGTIQEWSSNFDIGDTSDYYYIADWWNIQNHKGFDIAATRILKKVRTYVNTYVDTSVDNPIWITGHSRGAAIANILGADYEDDGYNTFTYTFAAPNTTTDPYAYTYSSIFNIVNEDDFVPCLPMNAWGFTRYGKTATISVADNYEVEWENLTGISDYNPDTIGMQDTVNEIAAIVNERNECNDYTCSCHGDGSLDNITIRNYGTSKSSREGAIAKIPSNALPYCIITRYDGWWIAGWDFECCQTPSYFMQVLAAEMAGTISAYRFAVELDIAARYEAAKSAIISSAIGGLAHPHYQETYYLLSTHVSSYNFN